MAAGEAEKFAFRYVRAALLDWQVWLHILVYMSIITPRKAFRYLSLSLAVAGSHIV